MYAVLICQALMNRFLHMTVVIGPSSFNLSNASHGTPTVNTARNIIHCTQPHRNNQNNNPVNPALGLLFVWHDKTRPMHLHSTILRVRPQHRITIMHQIGFQYKFFQNFAGSDIVRKP